MTRKDLESIDRLTKESKRQGLIFGGGIYPETSGVVHGALEGDARYKHSIRAIDAIALADVKPESLARSLDDLHEVNGVFRVL